MFRALKLLGVDTMLVRYIGEGTGSVRSLRTSWNYQRHLDWFGKYL